MAQGKGLSDFVQFSDETILWTASMILLKYLQTEQRKALVGQRVLELGSGLGHLGLGLRNLGAHVTCTERPQELQPLLANLTKHQDEKTPVLESALTLYGPTGTAEQQHQATQQDEQASEAAHMPLPPQQKDKDQGSIRAVELEWGKNGFERSPLSTQSLEPFDVIICSELYYIERLFPELLWTLRRFAGPHTTVWSIFIDRPFSFNFFALLHDEGCWEVEAVETFDDLGLDKELQVHMHRIRLNGGIDSSGSGELGMDQLKQLLVQYRPRYAVQVAEPFEPEPTFLIGKWADFGLCLFWALFFPVLRGLLRSLVYEPLGKSILFGAGATKLTGKQQDRLKKWNESCWKFTVFAIFTSIALAVSFGEPWFWETRYFWLGCKHFPPCNLSVSKGMLLFYTVETGFYMQGIHFLMFHEVRRKDWLESMVHHIATVALLTYSYYVNFSRVGVMILLVHDASDIFLEAAKLARYARRQNLAVLLFAMFTIIWIVTRNIIFPGVLIRSTLTESLYYAAQHGIKVEPHYTIFNSLLILLEILHIYWTNLILKIVYKQLSGHDARDIREEVSDDDE